MPAAKDEIAEAEEEHVEICAGWGPQELLQDESGHVTAVVFKKCLRTIDPETGRFSPAYDESETITIPADHVVFAIGQAIEWGSLLQDTKVEFHRGNYPVADPLTYQTAEEDIFVGGDVYHGPKFVIDAIEEGKCAAESLHRYVHKGADLKIGRNRRDFIMLDKENPSTATIMPPGRPRPSTPRSTRIRSATRAGRSRPSRSRPRRPAASAAARAGSTRTSASAAAFARRSASSTPSISSATTPNAPR